MPPKQGAYTQKCWKSHVLTQLFVGTAFLQAWWNGAEIGSGSNDTSNKIIAL